MVAKKITRTFAESVVTFKRFTIDNGVVKMEEPEESLTLVDVFTKERAVKAIPLNGADGVAILSIDPSETVYEMPVDVFRELAVKQGEKFDARAMVHRAMVAFHGELPEGEKEQLMMDIIQPQNDADGKFAVDTDSALIPDAPVDPVPAEEQPIDNTPIEPAPVEAAKTKKQNKKAEG